MPRCCTVCKRRTQVVAVTAHPPIPSSRLEDGPELVHAMSKQAPAHSLSVSCQPCWEAAESDRSGSPVTIAAGPRASLTPGLAEHRLQLADSVRQSVSEAWCGWPDDGEAGHLACHQKVQDRSSGAPCKEARALYRCPATYDFLRPGLLLGGISSLLSRLSIIRSPPPGPRLDP